MISEPISSGLQARLNRIDVLEEAVSGLLTYVVMQARREGWSIVDPKAAAVRVLIDSNFSASRKPDPGYGIDGFGETMLDRINAQRGIGLPPYIQASWVSSVPWIMRLCDRLPRI